MCFINVAAVDQCFPNFLESRKLYKKNRWISLYSIDGDQKFKLFHSKFTYKKTRMTLTWGICSRNMFNFLLHRLKFADKKNACSKVHLYRYLSPKQQDYPLDLLGSVLWNKDVVKFYSICAKTNFHEQIEIVRGSVFRKKCVETKIRRNKFRVGDVNQSKLGSVLVPAEILTGTKISVLVLDKLEMSEFRFKYELKSVPNFVLINLNSLCFYVIHCTKFA